MVSFNTICSQIKEVKIQGASDIAKAGLKAFQLKNDPKSIRKLLATRPTEPTLLNSINYAKKHGVKEAKTRLSNIQQKTIENGLNLIKSNKKIITHCHSNTVSDLFILAKKQKKNFKVLNFETRPLFQGRKTALELAKHKIPVTHMIDSEMALAVKDSDFIIIGADHITKKGDVINKIGSNMLAQLAKDYKKKFYVLTNSWKYSKNNFKIENRDKKEVWNVKNKYINIINPAFTKIDNKLITKIVSEYGKHSPKKFVRLCNDNSI